MKNITSLRIFSSPQQQLPEEQKEAKKAKNQSGMTLVEVVVAMAYFGTSMLGVCAMLAASVKFTARNMRRDNELNAQQTAIEQNTNEGVVLNDGTTLDGCKLVYTGDGINVSINNVSEYKAIKTAENSDEFNFEIKSFSSTPLGNTSPVLDKDAGKYGIYVINQSSENVDITISLTSGTIYTGDYDKGGYRHSSPTYIRSLAASGSDAVDSSSKVLPDRMLVGYYNTSLSATDTGTVTIMVRKGEDLDTYEISNAQLMSQGKASITISPSGTVNFVYEAP